MFFAITEHVGQPLKAQDHHEFQFRWAVLAKSLKTTTMIEAKLLFRTLMAWCRELLVYVRSRWTNTRNLPCVSD